MADEYLRPPQTDIERALAVERSVRPDEMKLYRECLGEKLMVDRVTPRELRDGCILVGVFEVCHRK